MKRRAYHLSKSKGELNLRGPRNLVTVTLPLLIDAVDSTPFVFSSDGKVL
jgi:hypothetical protein